MRIFRFDWIPHAFIFLPNLHPGTEKRQDGTHCHSYLVKIKNWTCVKRPEAEFDSLLAFNLIYLIQIRLTFQLIHSRMWVLNRVRSEIIQGLTLPFCLCICAQTGQRNRIDFLEVQLILLFCFYFARWFLHLEYKHFLIKLQLRNLYLKKTTQTKYKTGIIVVVSFKSSKRLSACRPYANQYGTVETWQVITGEKKNQTAIM